MKNLISNMNMSCRQWLTGRGHKDAGSASTMITWLLGLFLVTSVFGGAAVADQSGWQRSEYVSGNGQTTTPSYSRAYFRIEDCGPNYNNPYSSRFFADAYTRSPYWPYFYTYYYHCWGADSKDAAVSRIPDDSAMIGPNKDWSLTFEAPACPGYPAATFTVSCSAEETRHTNETTATKETEPDGTKTFLTYQEESVRSVYDPGTESHTCTVTFDNGNVRLEFNDSAYGNATDLRRREQ